jgi:hypothetical protein
MLVLQPTAPRRSSFWVPSAAFTILRGDAAIGRIELNGRPKRDGQAQIELGDDCFACRIHRTGWASPDGPYRWVMYEGDAERHAAVCKSARLFLIDGPEGLRLTRGGFRTALVIERGSDGARVGEIDRVPDQLDRIAVTTTLKLSERFEVFFLWLYAQDAFNSQD